MKRINLLITILVLALTFLSPVNTSAAVKQLEVHFINVGQGDATLIKAPNGKTMLIDGGPRTAGKELVAYIKAQNIKKLDYVVATHPDADHIGGLISVLNSISIGNFVDSGKEHTSDTYFDMLSLIDTKNIKFHVAKTGTTYNLDKTLKLEVLFADENATDNNDASIVLKLTHNKVSYLFMGDAGVDIEQLLMKSAKVNATVLKAGHHGSNTSSSSKFINTVKPKIGILSYGKDNSYGHPHAAVTSRLKKVGAKTFETAKHCNIVIKSDGIKTTESTGCKKAPAKSPATTVPKLIPKTTPKQPVTQTNFKNCTELRKVYSKGVQKGHAAYQSKMDRDKDGWACE